MKKLFAALAVLAVASVQSEACDHCYQPAGCAPAACKPAVQWKEVERTVLVPEWTTEKRKVSRTEYKHETSQREVTVNKWVQREEKVVREVTSYERVKKYRDVSYTVQKPVWKEVESTYTVKVPTRESRTGVRTVCRPVWKDVTEEYTCWEPTTVVRKQEYCVYENVPVTRTRTICEDKGHWEERPVQACNPCPTACGACHVCCNPCPATCTQKVWVPNIVEREVEYTAYECRPKQKTREVEVCVMKPVTKKRTRKVCEWVEDKEEYTYEVCGWKEEERTCVRKVCETVCEKKTRQVCYYECVPKTKKVEQVVCRWECVPQKKTIQETRCVPVKVEKVIDVPVCHMVEKKVKQRVCVPVTPHCRPEIPCHRPCCQPQPNCAFSWRT